MSNLSQTSVSRTRVKICGITEPESAQVAIAAGADALGLVFYEPSKRFVTIDIAKSVSRVAHPFVSLVGLFVNADSNFVNRVLSDVPLSLLQFHGEETPEFCESFNTPYIKALRVKPDLDIASEINRFKSAQAILLDTYVKGMAGGTGESFNWQLVPDTDQHLILAGGLDSSNVGSAIRQISPYAVDVSGGVESAPGIKDADRIRDFLKQVTEADLSLN